MSWSKVNNFHSCLHLCICMRNHHMALTLMTVLYIPIARHKCCFELFVYIFQISYFWLNWSPLGRVHSALYCCTKWTLVGCPVLVQGMSCQCRRAYKGGAWGLDYTELIREISCVFMSLPACVCFCSRVYVTLRIHMAMHAWHPLWCMCKNSTRAAHVPKCWPFFHPCMHILQTV